MPLGAGRGARKESAKRNSFPGPTLQARPESLLIRRILNGQQLREQAEKARPPAKNPWLASGPFQSSRWQLTRDSRVKIGGLMDH